MKKGAIAFCMMAAAAAAFAETSEIRVDLKLDATDYVAGERIRCVVDVANSSPDGISVGYASSPDRLFVEVRRASSQEQLTRLGARPFVSAFRLGSGEGLKLETFLGDHYALSEPTSYQARPVLVHGGIRYEGAIRAFNVVNGIRVSGAMQMFATRRGLQRNFSLVYWSRSRSEHLFLRAEDSGSSDRRWETRDLGAILRIGTPTISVLPGGEVVVLHRLNQDMFVRSELWSLPDELVFRRRETVRDPETAGTARVRELYKEGGVKPKDNPWWKFW